MNTFEKTAYKVVGISAIISNTIILFFSPFYEARSATLIVPFLSACMVLLFVFYLKMARWAYRISRPYALSAIVVHGLFLGKSNDAYGQYVQIMYAREIFEIVLGIMILIVYFLPGVRSFYKNTANL